MRRSSAGMNSPVLMSRFDWRAKGVPAAGFMLRVTSSDPKRMAEGDLRLVVQRPAAEDENGVLLEGGADLRPRGVVQEARDVRPVDLGGEVRRETGRDDGHGGGATPSGSGD